MEWSEKIKGYKDTYIYSLAIKDSDASLTRASCHRKKHNAIFDTLQLFVL